MFPKYCIRLGSSSFHQRASRSRKNQLHWWQHHWLRRQSEEWRTGISYQGFQCHCRSNQEVCKCLGRRVLQGHQERMIAKKDWVRQQMKQQCSMKTSWLMTHFHQDDVFCVQTCLKLYSLFSATPGLLFKFSWQRLRHLSKKLIISPGYRRLSPALKTAELSNFSF